MAKITIPIKEALNILANRIAFLYGLKIKEGSGDVAYQSNNYEGEEVVSVSFDIDTL